MQKQTTKCEKLKLFSNFLNFILTWDIHYNDQKIDWEKWSINFFIHLFNAPSTYVFQWSLDPSINLQRYSKLNPSRFDYFSKILFQRFDPPILLIRWKIKNLTNLDCRTYLILRFIVDQSNAEEWEADRVSGNGFLRTWFRHWYCMPDWMRGKRLLLQIQGGIRAHSLFGTRWIRRSISCTLQNGWLPLRRQTNHIASQVRLSIWPIFAENFLCDSKPLTIKPRNIF